MVLCGLNCFTCKIISRARGKPITLACTSPFAFVSRLFLPAWKNATKISPALEASWIWYHCTGILSKLQCTLCHDIRDLNYHFVQAIFILRFWVLSLNALYGRKRHQEILNMFLPLCSVWWQHLVFTSFTFSYKNISAYFFFASFLRSLLKKNTRFIWCISRSLNLAFPHHKRKTMR